MKEVKQPSKKPLVYYYLVALLILMVLNLTLFPAMLETPVQDVTYDQFMSMTYEQNVGQVQIEGDEITFTDKTNEKVYRTTATNDPDRTQRLYENGAQFQEIDTQPGLLTSILVGWVLPAGPERAAWKALCVFYNPLAETRVVSLPEGRWKLLSDGTTSALWQGESTVRTGDFSLPSCSAVIFGLL